MKSFSQRQGIKPVRNILQVEEMDSGLRTDLWNILDVYFWSTLRKIQTIRFYENDQYRSYPDYDGVCSLVKILWHDYFGKRIDEFHIEANLHFLIIKDYFLNCQWHEAYDFIEFVPNNYRYVERASQFSQHCNIILL